MDESLELVLYPDPVLKKVAEPVGEVTEEVREKAREMVRKMIDWRGLGLAAPQVGWSVRLAIVSDTGEEDTARVVIDPEIVEQDGAVAFDEGCLSFPGLTGRVTRSERIRVRYTNLEGERVEEEADGLLARCFLHELDHLNGILFITKMTPADRMRLKRALKELEEDYEAAQAAGQRARP